MPRMTRTWPRCPCCRTGPMRRLDGRETIHPTDPLEDLFGRLWECRRCGSRFYSVDRLVSREPETARYLRD